MEGSGVARYNKGVLLFDKLLRQIRRTVLTINFMHVSLLMSCEGGTSSGKRWSELFENPGQRSRSSLHAACIKPETIHHTNLLFFLILRLF